MTSTAIPSPPSPSKRPVWWDETIGAFRITGYTEASAVLCGDGWSSDPRHSPLATAAIQEMPPGALLFADPPEHTRLRRLLATAFTPKSISTLRPRIIATVDAVLDGLDELGPIIDILHDVAYPVTLAVIAELLDVGVEGAHLIAACTPAMTRGLEIDATTDELMASAVASTEATMFLTPILTERLRTPGKDFISALLALRDEPEGLDLGEVMSTCVLLLAAAHETTANLITNSSLALLTHPGQHHHLLARPDQAIEELLRLYGTAKIVARTATTDHRINGLRIPTGSAVMVHIHQANRDPQRFLDPPRLDLTRAPARHLGFGAGPHFCLGAALARMETVETLTRLFTRYPHLSLAGQQPRWRRSDTFHALHELPVHLSTQPRAGRRDQHQAGTTSAAGPERADGSLRGVIR